MKDKIEILDGLNDFRIDGHIKIFKHGNKVIMETYPSYIYEDKKPIYKHDCDGKSGCYLVAGGVELKSGKYDFYIHKTEDSFTPIARFGNEGADYLSGKFAIGNEDVLTEVFDKALASGLFEFLKIDITDVLNKLKDKK